MGRDVTEGVGDVTAERWLAPRGCDVTVSGFIAGGQRILLVGQLLRMSDRCVKFLSNVCG